jgi:cytochrome c peroxidase
MKRVRTPLLISFTCLLLAVSSHCPSIFAQSVDPVLRRLLEKNGVESVDPGGGHSDERIALGQALFFDRELSGNRDTSCATCHHPTLASGDGLALPVGTAPLNPGALGIDRILGSDREFVPRNAPEIFNRGSSLWKSMFWDSRVAELDDGTFTSPAGDQLLPGLSSALYIQAMFPVTSRDEMRGRDGDIAVPREGEATGAENEIAKVPDGDLHGIWDALMNRLMAINGYPELFAAAYPGIPLDEMSFAHAANAIGAFEINAFTFLDSPFDQYLAGNDSALSKREKRGAVLFYGKAKCANCHSGPLMTDQRHWGIAAPQLGPGKAPLAPRDAGRFLINHKISDLFAFRTPPLRNVAKTGPYMHDGAFKDLKSVIHHHANPAFRLLTYNSNRHLEQVDLRDTVLRDWKTFFLLTATLDLPPIRLSNRDVNDIEAFLKSLTAPDLEVRLMKTIPESVPSGLPVEGR